MQESHILPSELSVLTTYEQSCIPQKEELTFVLLALLFRKYVMKFEKINALCLVNVAGS